MTATLGIKPRFDIPVRPALPDPFGEEVHKGANFHWHMASLGEYGIKRLFRKCVIRQDPDQIAGGQMSTRHKGRQPPNTKSVKQGSAKRLAIVDAQSAFGAYPQFTMWSMQHPLHRIA